MVINTNINAMIGINTLRMTGLDMETRLARLSPGMATEITEFTRLQIMQQSGTAILGQANAQPQTILQLLG
jgi:flagellin